jgi:uncharacterized membrane protein YgcG
LVGYSLMLQARRQLGPLAPQAEATTTSTGGTTSPVGRGTSPQLLMTLNNSNANVKRHMVIMGALIHSTTIFFGIPFWILGIAWFAGLHLLIVTPMQLYLLHFTPRYYLNIRTNVASMHPGIALQLPLDSSEEGSTGPDLEMGNPNGTNNKEKDNDPSPSGSNNGHLTARDLHHQRQYRDATKHFARGRAHHLAESVARWALLQTALRKMGMFTLMIAVTTFIWVPAFILAGLRIIQLEDDVGPEEAFDLRIFESYQIAYSLPSMIAIILCIAVTRYLWKPIPAAAYPPGLWSCLAVTTACCRRSCCCCCRYRLCKQCPWNIQRIKITDNRHVTFAAPEPHHATGSHHHHHHARHPHSLGSGMAASGRLSVPTGSGLGMSSGSLGSLHSYSQKSSRSHRRSPPGHSARALANRAIIGGSTLSLGSNARPHTPGNDYDEEFDIANAIHTATAAVVDAAYLSPTSAMSRMEAAHIAGAELSRSARAAAARHGRVLRPREQHQGHSPGHGLYLLPTTSSSGGGSAHSSNSLPNSSPSPPLWSSPTPPSLSPPQVGRSHSNSGGNSGGGGGVLTRQHRSRSRSRSRGTLGIVLEKPQAPLLQASLPTEYHRPEGSPRSTNGSHRPPLVIIPRLTIPNVLMLPSGASQSSAHAAVAALRSAPSSDSLSPMATARHNGNSHNTNNGNSNHGTNHDTLNVPSPQCRSPVYLPVSPVSPQHSFTLSASRSPTRIDNSPFPGSGLANHPNNSSNNNVIGGNGNNSSETNNNDPNYTPSASASTALHEWPTPLDLNASVPILAMSSSS